MCKFIGQIIADALLLLLLNVPRQNSKHMAIPQVNFTANMQI